MAMLGLYVRQGAPWFADLRAELLSFPASKHDDQVDALGLVGQLLDRISAGQKPKPPEVAHKTPTARRLTKCTTSVRVLSCCEARIRAAVRSRGPDAPPFQVLLTCRSHDPRRGGLLASRD